MSQEFIFQMKGMAKRTPDGRELLKGFWLSFFYGAKIGVIGPNGSGKSTLLKIMAGLDTEVEGEVWLRPGARVGYLPQEPALDPTLDVRGNIELGLAHVRGLLNRFDQVNARFAEPMTDEEMDALIAEQAELQASIEAAEGWTLDYKVDVAMDALRVPAGDGDVTHLSGGEIRRVALCRLLLSMPDLLLLDEPTNHLDAESVAWLERTLREYPGTVIIVTHDRYFLDNVTGWILEIESGRGLPFEGNYSAWLVQKARMLQELGKEDSSRARSIAKELKWISMGQKDRREQLMSRLREYDSLLREMQSGRKAAAIVIPPGPRLGDLVVELKDVRKAYGDKLLFDSLNLSLPRGAIVGIVGPNGAGKTTLLRLITGEEKPDSGTIRLGETVKVAAAHQLRDELADDKTVFDNITGGNEILTVGRQELNARAYVSAFGLKGSQQQQKAGTLSGGERNRLYMAKVLLLGANVILFDEPTNDLDVSTLRELEDALESFPGCVLVITHDRWFLDRVATHILAFEGDSRVTWFEGNYQAYEADRKKRLGELAERPHRLKYRPLVS